MWSDAGTGLRERRNASTLTRSSWSYSEEGEHYCRIILKFRNCINWINRFALKTSGTKWAVRRKDKVKRVGRPRAWRESKGDGGWSWWLEKSTTETWSREG